MTSVNLSLIYGVSSDSEDHSPHPYLYVCVSHSVMSNSCDPPDCSPPGSSIYGILQERILERISSSLSPGLLHCRWKLYRLVTPFTYLGNSHLFYPVLWPKKTPSAYACLRLRQHSVPSSVTLYRKRPMCPYPLADHEYLEVKDSAKWAIKKYLSNT